MMGKLEARIEELESELGSAEDAAADLEVERDDLKGDLSVAEAKINILDEEVTRVTAQRDEKQRQFDKLWKKKDEEVAELQRQLEGQKMSFREVVEAKDVIVAQLEELQKEKS